MIEGIYDGIRRSVPPMGPWRRLIDTIAPAHTHTRVRAPSRAHFNHKCGNKRDVRIKKKLIHNSHRHRRQQFIWIYGVHGVWRARSVCTRISSTHTHTPNMCVRYLMLCAHVLQQNVSCTVWFAARCALSHRNLMLDSRFFLYFESVVFICRCFIFRGRVHFGRNHLCAFSHWRHGSGRRKPTHKRNDDRKKSTRHRMSF